MKKQKREFNLEAFNTIMENIPQTLSFKERAVVVERVRKCVQCKYLASDIKCAKCDCKFYEKIVNPKQKCPQKLW